MNALNALPDEELCEIVLRQCNEIRVALGNEELTELPRGIPRRSSHCVVARALSNGWRAFVTGDHLWFGQGHYSQSVAASVKALRLLRYNVVEARDNDFAVRSTDEMRELIVRFDANYLPDLIARGEV